MVTVILIHGNLLKPAFDKLLDVLWVKPFAQGTEAREIHEEYRTILALTFQGTPGVQDPLGRIIRDIPQWRWGMRREGSARLCSVSGIPRSRRNLARGRVYPTLGAVGLQEGYIRCRN
jgi:hypothetical protein